MIVVLVPVLDRPHRVQPLLESIESATPEPHRVLFITQSDDTKQLAALEQSGAEFIVVEPARRSYAKKINDGYRATTEPWLFLAADDLAFRADWFSRALEWGNDSTQVIGTNDICNPRVMCGKHSTHTLARRSYIADRSGVVDQPDVVLNEQYDHEYCDDEFVQTAMARGVYVHAFDSIVEHLHPINERGVGLPDDATYRLGRRKTRESRMIFQKRRRLWANL